MLTDDDDVTDDPDVAFGFIVFYQRDTGLPMAFLAGDVVCRFDMPEYSLEDFFSDTSDRDMERCILVDIEDVDHLDATINQFIAGHEVDVTYMGPFKMSEIADVGRSLSNVELAEFGTPPPKILN